MYFDLQLWRMTEGLRGRIVLAVVLGLCALAAGIARFAFLGWLLALVFQSAPFAQLLLPLGGIVCEIGGIALAHMLTESGRIETEFTVTRLADNHFYVLSAAVAQHHDMSLMTNALKPGEQVTITGGLGFERAAALPPSR